MGLSFPALTRGLLNAAVARREGKREGEEDKRRRRSESLLDTLRVAGARDAGVIEGDNGFTFDPTQTREFRDNERRTTRNRGAFDELLGRGDITEGTEFNPDINFGDIRDESLIDTIKRTQAERMGPEPLSEQDKARLRLTGAQADAASALAENRSRERTQDNPQAKRLNAVTKDLVSAREAAVRSGVLLTPDGKASLGKELDAVARLHGYGGVAEVAQLTRERGQGAPSVQVPGIPDIPDAAAPLATPDIPPAPDPAPDPEQAAQTALELATMLEEVRGSSMSPELKAIAQEIAESTELTDAERLDLLRELVSG